MELSTDGEDQQLISNLAYTLLLLLKRMQSQGYRDWANMTPLLKLLREWLTTHGTTTQIEVGADYTKNSGIASEQLSIEMLKAMQQNVLGHIKANGFPEKDQVFAVRAVVPLTTKEGMSLTIKLRTEKVLFD